MSTIRKVERISYADVIRAWQEWGTVYLAVGRKGGKTINRVRRLSRSGRVDWAFTVTGYFSPHAPSCWQHYAPLGKVDRVLAMKKYDKAELLYISGIYRTEKDLRDAYKRRGGK